MRHLDLFSGIGGFAIAAQNVWKEDYEIVAFCDIDEFCQHILRKHFPEVPIINDIYQLKGRQFEEVDLITGGFPCQPFSVAGKRKGKKDERYLWPQMLRVIAESKPRWVVAENVAGIISMVLDETLSDLEAHGYEAQAFVVPACAINAPHRRDRVWIIGCHRQKYLEQNQKDFSPKDLFKKDVEDFSDTAGWRLWRTLFTKSPIGTWTRGYTILLEGRNLRETDHNWWDTEPDVGRVAHGISNRVDRLRALGNAIVPQVAEVIFRAIKRVDQQFLPPKVSRRQIRYMPDKRIRPGSHTRGVSAKKLLHQMKSKE